MMGLLTTSPIIRKIEEEKKKEEETTTSPLSLSSSSSSSSSSSIDEKDKKFILDNEHLFLKDVEFQIQELECLREIEPKDYVAPSRLVF